MLVQARMVFVDRLQIGMGNINFVGTQFGGGDIYFNKAKFGDGDVHFCDSQFGEGEISFNGAQFGKGKVDFSEAKFGEGETSFNGAQFGKGKVDFSRAKFGEGKVDFTSAQFEDGKVDFHEAQFGEGLVSFHITKFGARHVDFTDVNFGDSIVLFNQSIFSTEHISLARIKCNTSLTFAPMLSSKLKKIDFSSSIITGELYLADFKTSAVVDLRRTQISHTIDLDRVDISYLTESYKKFFKRAKSTEDSTCFRRLKKLAKEAEDHRSALDFFAKEKRSDYWHGITGAKLIMYYLFDWCSDYGRSVLRPSVGLFISCVLFSLSYWFGKVKTTASYWDAFVYSLGNTIPIYPGSRQAQIGAISELFFKIEVIPHWINITTAFQNVLSTVFIFLIALALRNMFRT